MDIEKPKTKTHFVQKNTNISYYSNTKLLLWKSNYEIGQTGRSIDSISDKEQKQNEPKQQPKKTTERSIEAQLKD